MKFFSAYDGREAELSDLSSHGPFGESLTVQSQAEDADINVIVKRYGITGKLPENPRIPTYGDFSEITDFRSAFEAVQKAEAGFMEIPADIRAKFDNDPQKLLLFAADPVNIPAMREIGLMKKEYVDGGSSKAGSGGGSPAPGPSDKVGTEPGGSSSGVKVAVGGSG